MQVYRAWKMGKSLKFFVSEHLVHKQLQSAWMAEYVGINLKKSAKYR